MNLFHHCFSARPLRRIYCAALAGAATFPISAAAQSTNALGLNSPPVPDVGASLLRVLGALGVVLAVFLGGIWLFRNWQRLAALRSGRTPRLSVVESRSLGGRHALYVVGYEQERYLIAASPNGVNLLTHLPASDEPAAGAGTVSKPSFAQALAQTLKGK
jgi:flagellar biogenesis protein FliO